MTSPVCVATATSRFHDLTPQPDRYDRTGGVTSSSSVQKPSRMHLHTDDDALARKRTRIVSDTSLDRMVSLDEASVDTHVASAIASLTTLTTNAPLVE